MKNLARLVYLLVAVLPLLVLRAKAAPSCDPTTGSYVCTYSTYPDSCGNAGACQGTKACAVPSSPSPSPSASAAAAASPSASASAATSSPTASPSPTPSPSPVPAILIITDIGSADSGHGWCHHFQVAVTPQVTATFQYLAVLYGTNVPCDLFSDSMCNNSLGLSCGSTITVNSGNGYVFDFYGLYNSIGNKTDEEAVIIKAVSQTPGVTSGSMTGL